METTEISPGIFLTHHPAYKCEGQICTIHNQTDHEYREFPQVWKDGIMWRNVDGVLIPDPDDRNVIAGGYLLRNSAKCLECGDEIESTFRHDFVSCSCGNLCVDGGHDYNRRVFASDNWADTSVYLP